MKYSEAESRIIKGLMHNTLKASEY